MAEPIDIAGSVSVVTGGASGIGKGIVKALLNNGGTVVVADIEEQQFRKLLQSLKSSGLSKVASQTFQTRDLLRIYHNMFLINMKNAIFSLIMRELVQAVEEKRGRTNLTIGNGALELMFSDQLMELSHLFQR